MSRFKIGIAALGATIGILTATSVGAWERGPVDVLAVLPDFTQNVQSSAEGLTVGPDGNIYVTTFGFNTHGALTGNSVLFVISPSGNIVRKVDIQGPKSVYARPCLQSGVRQPAGSRLRRRHRAGRQSALRSPP